MKGKGFIKFFAVLLLIVSIYQLSFTFVARKVEKYAREEAEKPYKHLLDPQYIQQQFGDDRAKAIEFIDSIQNLIKKRERRILDSLRDEVVYDLGFVEFTYLDVKERELNLGLDLRGGMSVTLQVDIPSLVRELAGPRRDTLFDHAFKVTLEKYYNGEVEDFIEAFVQEIERRKPTVRLARYFATRENKDEITIASTNEEVKIWLKKEAEDAFYRTYNIIRTRIDKFGVAQPLITMDPVRMRILVELPGVDDPERVHRILKATARLEFWETYENAEIIPYLVDVNEVLKKVLTPPTKVEQEQPVLEPAPDLQAPESTEEVPSLLEESESSTDTNTQQIAQDTSSVTDTSFIPEGWEPLYEVMGLAIRQTAEGQEAQKGPVVGYVRGKDTAKVNDYLSIPEVKNILPRDLWFAWSAKPVDEDGNIYALYALKSRGPGRQPALTGDVIVSARVDFDPVTRRPVVMMEMNQRGARLWRRLTAENIGKSIAIVLDDRVYSAPVVESEIPNGRSVISGNFTIEEARDLATILESGKLPVSINIVEEEVVGATLGEQSIRAGLTALAIGFIIVVIFTIFYYGTAGVVTIFALLLNIIYVIGILSALGATLTLAGLAGLVLTVGMAVDANVIIFERIREEMLKPGKSFRLAVIDGFRKSYWAIIDANVTTLIAGIILLIFGSGPIQGFATVLVIGILSTLFTAVLVVRLIFEWILDKKESILNFGKAKFTQILQNIKVDWLGKRKKAYIVSGTLVVLSLIAIGIRGFELGVDFLGGHEIVLRFDKPVEVETIRKELTETLGKQPIVRTFGSANQVKVTTTIMAHSLDPKADSIVLAKIYEGIKSITGEIDYETFIRTHVVSIQKIGPVIAEEIRQDAIIAGILGLLLMFGYIALRFRNWQFGVGAVAALAHDVTITLGFFAALHGIVPFSLEINQAIIGAILTIIGYSINDTVIVFDRIREFLELRGRSRFAQVINEAISSTLSRTLITSLTTLLTILSLFLFGGEVLRGFSFALLIGVLVGTYSSIFIATPVAYDLMRRKKK
ncbi:MAG: protein translocase subunit SecDF [Chlorobi bacterium]|nr:protein translocase subunit SecDF [Chlorobiota bacterium]